MGGLVSMLCAPCLWLFRSLCAQTLQLRGGSRVRVGEMIGEGGFSYIYEAHPSAGEGGLVGSPGRALVLKKMVCVDEAAEDIASREVWALREFRGEGIVPLVDHLVRQEVGDGGGGKKNVVYYMLMPRAERGTLRDEITAWQERRRRRWGERDIMRIFRTICVAVQRLHAHDPSYVHGDIKVENVLVTADGQYLLTDFGSVMHAHRVVNTRLEGLAVQDDAARLSSMPYRAPELWDCPCPATLDARTDVWALGCLLFALAYGYSPFECEFGTDGHARVVECSHVRVLSGVPTPPSQDHNSSGAMSEDFATTVNWILNPDFTNRPFVSDVLERITRGGSGGSGGGDVALHKV